MKKIETIGFFCLFFANLLNAQLNNESILKMFDIGLSEKTVQIAIENEECQFDVSVDGLVELKSSGVSETLIQAMITAMNGGESLHEINQIEDESYEDGSVVDVAPPFIDPAPGNEYYARFTFYHERGKYKATNYRRGMIVPINTVMKLISYGSNEMLLKIKGEMIRVKNIKKYTQGTIEEFASLMLSDRPTAIEEYGETRASAIKSGTMRLGMTRDEVLMTRGYPPKHETPSLQMDRWVYWSSRYVKRTIVFYNEVLSEGRGIN